MCTGFGPTSCSPAKQCDNEGCWVECAAGDCNSKQVNLGGDLIILDVQSFVQPRQGYNEMNPSTCCQACKDMDGCNAWVVCSKKVG